MDCEVIVVGWRIGTEHSLTAWNINDSNSITLQHIDPRRDEGHRTCLRAEKHYVSPFRKKSMHTIVRREARKKLPL